MMAKKLCDHRRTKMLFLARWSSQEISKVVVVVKSVVVVVVKIVLLWRSKIALLSPELGDKKRQEKVSGKLVNWLADWGLKKEQELMMMMMMIVIQTISRQGFLPFLSLLIDFEALGLWLWSIDRQNTTTTTEQTLVNGKKVARENEDEKGGKLIRRGRRWEMTVKKGHWAWLISGGSQWEEEGGNETSTWW